ncbi:MAG: SelB C-terminal domain-containing protein, partial [bacterium]
RLASFSPELDEDQSARASELLETLAQSGLETPDREELEKTFSTEILEYLIRQDEIVQLSEDRLISTETYQNAVQTVRSYLKEHQPAPLKDLRDALDSSRKYVIPLMEYLDQEGITIRDGDVRHLRNEPAASDGEEQ